MYFNDVHILWYVLFGVIALLLGQFIDYISKSFIKEKKIFNKAEFKEYAKTTLPNYILILAMVISYIALIYKFGIYSDITKNVDLIKYMLLIPMLFCAFYVDLKKQIIPNRLNMLMFEVGLIFAVLSGFSNINVAINMFLRNDCRWGNILTYHTNWWNYCRQRGHGTGRCKVNGGAGVILWTKLHYSNISHGIFNWGNRKHNIYDSQI